MTVTKVPISSITNAPNGIAGLGADGKLSSAIPGRVCLWDFLDASERAQLLTSSTALNLLPKLQAAIASASQAGSFVYPVAGIVELPRGTIYCAGTLTLETSVRLVGHGAGMQGGNWGTKLKFPANVSGIVCKKGNVGQNGADATLIDGVFIEGGGGTSDTAHGLDMQCRVSLRNVTVAGFAGHGVNIDADIAANKNANLWELSTCVLLLNRRDGLYVKGGDANAGLCFMVDANANGGFGINDSSFLGNTYVGCHTDQNGRRAQVHHAGNRYYVKDLAGAALAGSTVPGTDGNVWELSGPGAMHPTYWPEWVNGGTYIPGGAYQSLGLSARNVFLGCYSESGSQAPSNFTTPSCLVLGGLHAAGMRGKPSFYGDGVLSAFHTATTPGGAWLALGQGADGDAEALLSLHDPSSSGVYPYRVKYATGAWALGWGNVKPWLQLFNRDTTPANGFARDLSAANGGMGFPDGYYLGNNALTKVTPGTAAPVAGTHARGDQVINTAPSAGGFAGWICVTAGTPGTWKTFGAISA